MKTKTITVTLTANEVDTLEDMLFCVQSDEQLVANQPYRSALWYKIAREFDKEAEVKRLSEKLSSMTNDFFTERTRRLELTDKLDGAESRLAKARELINSILGIFNYRFGIGWIEREFDASNYEASDSINASDSIAELLRNAALGGVSGGRVEAKGEDEK